MLELKLQNSLEGNIEANLHDLRFCNRFLDMTTKEWATTTTKVDNLDFIKI